MQSTPGFIRRVTTAFKWTHLSQFRPFPTTITIELAARKLIAERCKLALSGFFYTFRNLWRSLHELAVVDLVFDVGWLLPLAVLPMLLGDEAVDLIETLGRKRV